MKIQHICGPCLGSLVYKLLGGITLEYDLCLGCTIARWKGIDEELHFKAQSCLQISLRFQIVKKCRFGPQNGPESLGPEKLLKIVNCQKTVLSQLE
jgi:hypothetical protein